MFTNLKTLKTLIIQSKEKHINLVKNKIIEELQLTITETRLKDKNNLEHKK